MVAQPTALSEGSHDRGSGLHWSRPTNRRHGFIGPRQLELGGLGYCGTKMGSPENAVGDIVRALSDDHLTSWANFVEFASPAVWKASLNADPRRQQADALFNRLMGRLHADRLMLPIRLETSGLPVAAFLVREISANVDHWLVDLFRSGSPEAGEALVRVLLPEIRTWVQRTAQPGRQSGVEDTVQDVLVGLLADSGRRITAYAGSGPFRGYLRTVVIRMATDSMRRETGRWRPDAKTGFLTRRPSSVSLTDDAHPIDLADERANPEEALLGTAEMISDADRMEALLKLVRALPPEVQRIMEARFLDGHKPGEIAKRTGRDVKVIYKILEHTLVDLKKTLK